jgi:DNA-binding NarL/FixJ family response regulator
VRPGCAALLSSSAGRGAIQPEQHPQPEKEILQPMARGLSNSEIAGELYLGLQTVKPHVSSLLRTLGSGIARQAVIAAYESGRVPLT